MLGIMVPPTAGIGSQKRARKVRLKEEIKRFVFANPGCSAQSIVAFLSVDKNMRNHGLTPRKIGFFIPRHLKTHLTWWQDHTAGRRVYGPTEGEESTS
ncbi:MAG: hypothetical protein NZ737_02760 [Candidatus Poseidoniaceae archaeon]|nr:hypothetical protein [Candidatus Poseidoniaceae archaeon]